jgi:hypothetical protein
MQRSMRSNVLKRFFPTIQAGYLGRFGIIDMDSTEILLLVATSG